jgi:uncharacterized protein (TIGR03118 family)
MKKIFVKATNLYWVVLCTLLVAAGCQKNIETPITNASDASSQSNAANERGMKGNFQQVNVVADIAYFNPMVISPDLNNSWGLAFDPSGSAFVVQRFGCLVYNVLAPTAYPPFIYISPYPDIPEAHGSPTGIVLNGSNDFVLPNGLPALSIFVGADGYIYGGPFQMQGITYAVPILDNSSTAVYTGVTIADDGGSFLYAANFKAKRIDVYDGNWQPVNDKPFKDPSIPPDYAPFNIQNINNNLFVMYAKTVSGNADLQVGAGLGYVDIFKPDGTLLTSFAKGGVLNAPWGCAIAPASWTNKQWDGNASNYNDAKHSAKSVILIANHGDGHINAFNQDGQFLGSLRSGKKEAITIEDLWALSFAPATATTIDPNWLFFTAGPGGGTFGLFGYLQSQ